ncbi:hypothetical protein [Actinomyces procaprae]|uniref:hypothetical protein n=1 Tax=Actinomyces procaprae TaxID=2560010 RepID=UPI0010A280ED|nr:hypothetical protein [Actinomyces procaprae]
MSRTFVLKAERGIGNWWVLEVPEVGAVSQVRRLDQARDEMREAVAYLAGIPESEVDFDVQTTLPADYVEHMAEARRLREQADAATRRAADESRAAARVLREGGLTLREVGMLMGVSHQRVAQLLDA